MARLDGATTGTITDTARPLTIRVNRTGLERGSYDTSLHVTSNGGNVTVAVQMEVLGPNEPRLSVTPLSLDFGKEATERSLTIENLGTGLLVWSVQSKPSWLSVTPSGSLFLAATGDELYRIDPTSGHGEKTSPRFDKLKGVTADASYLITWEGGLIKRRDPGTLAQIHLANFGSEGLRLGSVKFRYETNWDGCLNPGEKATLEIEFENTATKC